MSRPYCTPGRARRLARPAVEAQVEVLLHVVVERERAVDDLPHEVDAAARRVGLVAGLDVGGATARCTARSGRSRGRARSRSVDHATRGRGCAAGAGRGPPVAVPAGTLAERTGSDCFCASESDRSGVGSAISGRVVDALECLGIQGEQGDQEDQEYHFFTDTPLAPCWPQAPRQKRLAVQATTSILVSICPPAAVPSTPRAAVTSRQTTGRG